MKVETKFEKEDQEDSSQMPDDLPEISDMDTEEKLKKIKRQRIIQMKRNKRGRPKEHKIPKKEIFTGKFCCIECKNAGLKKTKWNFFSESRYQLHLKIHYVKVTGHSFFFVGFAPSVQDLLVCNMYL